MEKESSKLALILGTFVFLGIIIVMGMIVFMTGGASFLDNTYKVIVHIDNIGDLKTGAPVKIGGVKVGKVEGISIAKNSIEVIAGIFTNYDIRTDSEASIATAGLVGDSFLELTRGKSKTNIRKSLTVANAQEIKGSTQAGMAELLGQVQSIGSEVESLVKNINKVIGDSGFQTNVEETMSNVNKATHQAELLLESLRGELKAVGEAVDNVVKITSSAGDTIKTIDNFVDKTIGQPEKIENINKTIDSISELTASLAANKDLITTTITNISDTTGNLANITNSINPNEGILRLLSDEQAGNDIMDTLKQVQRAAKSLATIGLTDLLADKLAADKIFEIWQKEHKFSDANEMSIKWKEWMAYQKRVNASIMSQNGTTSQTTVVRRRRGFPLKSNTTAANTMLPAYGGN